MPKRDTTKTGLILGVAVALLLAVGGSSAAQEDAKPTPAERFRSVVESFPAPTAANGFTFTGSIVFGEVAVGEVRMAAEVVREGERELWKTTESMRIEVGGKKMLFRGESLLGADLSAVRGKGGKEMDGVAKEWVWERTKDGFRIVTTTAGKESVRTVEGGGYALPSGAASLLLCRMLPKGNTDEYDLREFDPEPDDGNHLGTARLRASGPGEWKGSRALIFTHDDNSGTVTTFALGPESGDVLGVRIADADGVITELHAGKKVAEPEAKISFLPPGKSPKQAALIIALAFGTMDFFLLDRMTDWPTVVADLRTRYPGKEFEEEALRLAIKSRLDGAENRKKHEEVAPALTLFAGQLEVDRAGDDRATVRFPEAFQSLVLELRRFGEEWRLVVIPGT